MVIRTGNKTTDAVFRAFQSILKGRIKNGRDACDREVLESALLQISQEMHMRPEEIRKAVDYANPNDARFCASIRLSVEKGLRLYEIQAARVKALLEDYMRRSPYDFSFQVRRNYTVTMRYVLPSKQVLSVPISFRSVLEGGLSEEYEKGLQSVMDFSLKFGRMTIR